MPTDVIDTELGRVEVVLIRKLPEGQWDINMEQIKGVKTNEVVDDGTQILRKGQIQDGCLLALCSSCSLPGDPLELCGEARPRFPACPSALL